MVCNSTFSRILCFGRGGTKKIAKLIAKIAPGRVLECFSNTLDIGESYALGSLAMVFQTEVYAILACSD
jgi:hypothetical protein